MAVEKLISEVFIRVPCGTRLTPILFVYWVNMTLHCITVVNETTWMHSFHKEPSSSLELSLAPTSDRLSDNVCMYSFPTSSTN